MMDLLLLARDIQEQVLGLDGFDGVFDGVEPLSERALWPIAKTLSWAEQRATWAAHGCGVIAPHPVPSRAIGSYLTKQA